MIRRATIKDLDAIMLILKSIGNAAKDPAQGFLMADYTKDEETHRQKYAHLLDTLTYTYVYENDGNVESFLIAYTMDQWQKEAPNWLEDTYWHPNFDHTRLKSAILIYQTAMYPHLTGKGIGSKIYVTLFKDLEKDGITNMFAETIVAPTPNFASLNFRIKQNYELAGMRYELFEGTVYTTLIYCKSLN